MLFDLAHWQVVSSDYVRSSTAAIG